MTVEELAGCIAVVKNLLLARELTVIEAVNVLWCLCDETTDSAHYVFGTSRVIDQLLRKHNANGLLLVRANVQPSKEESHGPDKV